MIKKFVDDLVQHHIFGAILSFPFSVQMHLWAGTYPAYESMQSMQTLPLAECEHTFTLYRVVYWIDWKTVSLYRAFSLNWFFCSRAADYYMEILGLLVSRWVRCGFTATISFSSSFDALLSMDYDVSMLNDTSENTHSWVLQMKERIVPMLRLCYEQYLSHRLKRNAADFSRVLA